MDIVKDFIKASLKEANRSEASIIYNSNLSYCEKLAIILAKRLNGRVLKNDKYYKNYCVVVFDLPQNYSLKVSQSDINPDPFGYITLSKNNIEIFDQSLMGFKYDNLESYSDTINEYAKIYKVPVEVITKAFEYILKVISITSTFNNQVSSRDQAKIYKKSTITRQKLERYKKEYAYYRSLFVKSGVISEEDLARYIISVVPEECKVLNLDLDDYGGGGLATFLSKIAFTFRDRITKAIYKFIYSVELTAGMDGNEWLTGDVYDDIEVDLCGIETDGPENGELEDHLVNIIDDFTNSDMFIQYINDNLDGITGYDIK